MKYYANYINRRGESCSLPFFSLDVAEDYCYLLVLAGDIKGFTIDVYDCDYSDYDARRLVDSFIHLDSDPETFREAVRRFGTIEAKRKYGVDVDSVNTAEQGEPVDVENTSASEQDSTVEKSSKKSKLGYLAFPLSIFAFFFFFYVYCASHYICYHLNEKAFSGGMLFAYSLACCVRLFFYVYDSFFNWFKQLKAVENIKNRLPHYRKGGRKKSC